MVAPSSHAVETDSQDAAISDIREIDLPPLEDVPKYLYPLLRDLKKAFGPALPDDITYDYVTTTDPALKGIAFKTNYDEGFCGHFSIPDGDGAAADFEKVMDLDDPFGLIEKSLQFKPAKGRKGLGEGELVVFTPGLNTLHMLKKGWEQETTTPMRMHHYVDTVGAEMCQMHLGADMDQGAASLKLRPFIKRMLIANKTLLEASNVMPYFKDGNTAVWRPRQRDRVEAALSQMGYARPQFLTNIAKLLEHNETAKRQLVLFPYSRSTSEVSGALRLYISQYLERHENEDPADVLARVERYLRKYVVVLSFGNADRMWPDGPAYVHMSAISDRKWGGTDPLTQRSGVSINHPQGAGRDATFLHHDGVFGGFNAHNFGAAGAPALRLIMGMNGYKTFRQLYEGLVAGTLRMPDYEQTLAAAVLVGGQEWLFGGKDKLEGLKLPTLEESKRAVGQWM